MRQRWRYVAVISVVALGLSACSGSGDGDRGIDAAGDRAASSSSADSGHDMGGHEHGTDATSVNGCPVYMPEDVLTAEQAMITFDGTQVCLGYVTVRPGTEVTWHNEGDVPVSLALYDEYPADDTVRPTATETIAAGALHAQAFDDPGSRYYTVESLPGFVGTVEVKAK